MLALSDALCMFQISHLSDKVLSLKMLIEHLNLYCDDLTLWGYPIPPLFSIMFKNNGRGVLCSTRHFKRKRK